MIRGCGGDGSITLFGLDVCYEMSFPRVSTDVVREAVRVILGLVHASLQRFPFPNE